MAKITKQSVSMNAEAVEVGLKELRAALKEGDFEKAARKGQTLYQESGHLAAQLQYLADESEAEQFLSLRGR